jgi:hypothetical protein
LRQTENDAPPPHLGVWYHAQVSANSAVKGEASVEQSLYANPPPYWCGLRLKFVDDPFAAYDMLLVVVAGGAPHDLHI